MKIMGIDKPIINKREVVRATPLFLKENTKFQFE